MGELWSFENWLLILLVIYLGRLMIKYEKAKTSYGYYYFFLFMIFYGPILYYSLGYNAYYTMITDSAMIVFMRIGVLIYIINILFFIIVMKGNKYMFYNFFKQIKKREVNSEKLLTLYFVSVYVFVMFYIIIYFNRFPLIQLFKLGDLGVRPDTVEIIPLYITISSIFMTIIPSAFFYLYYRNNSMWVKVTSLLLTVFIMIIGGNKGTVSFFILFLFYYGSKKISILKMTGTIFVLMFIYAYTKGITALDADVIAYLLESPFKRLFATQGVGFIGRIDMVQRDLFDLSSNLGIKNQVYEKMYWRKGGSVPTMFLGDLFVKYGYFFMFISYFFYLIPIIYIMKTIDKFFTGKMGMYITWNLFIVVYLYGLSDISMGNTIRVGFVVINLLMINLLVRLKMPKKILSNVS